MLLNSILQWEARDPTRLEKEAESIAAELHCQPAGHHQTWATIRNDKTPVHSRETTSY